MSAYLDKSQGITFVYSNIFELYKKAKEAKLDDPFVAERPRVVKNATASLSAFQPSELRPGAGERPLAAPAGAREAEEKEKRIAAPLRPVARIQKNLNDLSEAHEKLRFLLQELDAITKKKS